MKLARRTIGAVTVTLLVAGCGIFGDDDEELPPQDLREFEPSVTIKRVWSSGVGGKAENLRVAVWGPERVMASCEQLDNDPAAEFGDSGLDWQDSNPLDLN